MPLSTFLNGRAPDSLRGLQWLALSDVGTHLTRTSTSDSGGGVTETWGTAGTAIPCKAEPIISHAARGLLAGRIDERSTHTVTVPAGTPVDTDDRFAITGRGTFEVTALRQQTAEWVREFEVIQVT
jgi:hypothetical protein